MKTLHPHEALTQNYIKTYIHAHTKMNIQTNIQTIFILKIVICTAHQNIYDLQVMTYNFMYSFQHTFSFYTYKQ
jgi:hypothetical protein